MQVGLLGGSSSAKEPGPAEAKEPILKPWFWCFLDMSSPLQPRLLVGSDIATANKETQVPWGQGAGERAQRLGALVALKEDSGAIPITHLIDYNHPELQFQGI